jgi:hypothetical protein
MRPAGFHHTKETKEKLSLNNRHWNKGLTAQISPSVKQQSESLKNHWKQNQHPKGMLGKNHSEETKKKMRSSRQGIQNANWKGGITRLLRGIRRSSEYYQWRKEVLNRDRRCRNCGIDKKLNAHHIKAILEYPELIFDIRNGMTLCEDCHKTTDSYGIKKKGEKWGKLA